MWTGTEDRTYLFSNGWQHKNVALSIDQKIAVFDVTRNDGDSNGTTILYAGLVSNTTEPSLPANGTCQVFVDTWSAAHACELSRLLCESCSGSACTNSRFLNNQNIIRLCQRAAIDCAGQHSVNHNSARRLDATGRMASLTVRKLSRTPPRGVL